MAFFFTVGHNLLSNSLHGRQLGLNMGLLFKMDQQVYDDFYLLNKW